MSIEHPVTPSEEQARNDSPFLTLIKEGLRDVRGCQGRIIPEVSDRYLDIQQELIASEKEGVTVFFGGPMDLVNYGIEDVWLTPVEVRDKDGFSNFHVISIGCKSGKDFSDATVTINLTPEVNLKLGRATESSVQELHQALHEGGDEKKRVIVRPSITGSLAFPLITTPLDVPPQDIFRSRLKKVLGACGLDSKITETTDVTQIDEQRFELGAEFENFYLSKPRIVETPIGKVWVYGVAVMEDPWRYYEIFALEDIQKIREEQKIIMRTDSGCDIGMLYGDLGCDCHSQLLKALEEARDFGGMIVHIPTQDGRGYGINTKIETEAHKRGIAAVFNVGEPPMGTLTAAKRLFGGTAYDIRTYDGVAKMLAELGFREVVVITDNRIKCNHMATIPILSIDRKETGTLEQARNDNARAHIEEKHDSDDYFHPS